MKERPGPGSGVAPTNPDDAAISDWSVVPAPLPPMPAFATGDMWALC